MDTSILGTLFDIAPDLMEEIELRTLVLERVAALGPIGRRALAQRLCLPEREVRSAADALRGAGCIHQSAAGMELTERGRGLVETARAVSRGRRSLSSIELALSHKLGVERVCVVRGDADTDESVLAEAAEAAARQVRFLLQDAHVLAVSGGRMLRMTAEAVSLAVPLDVTVVPAQGGGSGAVAVQANAVAEEFAGRLGGQYRLLHLPEGVSAQAIEELSRVAQVREALELLRRAGLEVVSVICKTGGVDKERCGIPDEHKLRPGNYEAMCNPIAQAMLLNEQKTQFNIALGLCVGHDSMFYKYSDALVTTLVAKDRVTGHSPAAALYCAEGYFKNRI